MVSFILALVLLQVIVMLTLFTWPKSNGAMWWFYAPSLVIAWAGYIAYEAIYIPRNCTGDCAIRVDLLIIFPYLALVTICAIAYFVRRGPKTKEQA